MRLLKSLGLVFGASWLAHGADGAGKRQRQVITCEIFHTGIYLLCYNVVVDSGEYGLRTNIKNNTNSQTENQMATSRSGCVASFGCGWLFWLALVAR